MLLIAIPAWKFLSNTSEQFLFLSVQDRNNQESTNAQLSCWLICLLIGLKNMLIFQGLFYAERLGNRIYCTEYYLFFFLYFVFQSFFCAYLYNISDNSLKQIIRTHLHSFKYSYLIPIIIRFQVILSNTGWLVGFPRINHFRVI